MGHTQVAHEDVDWTRKRSPLVDVIIMSNDKQLFSTYREELHQSYIDIFQLPKNATRRLVEVKLCQLEVETKNRELTANEPALLENILKDEKNKYDLLVKLTEQNKRERINREKTMLFHERESEFYRVKVKQLSGEELEAKEREVGLLRRRIKEDRGKLERLRKELAEFSDMAPNNEALQKRIEELKKRRQSLDITFVDSP